MLIYQRVSGMILQVSRNLGVIFLTTSLRPHWDGEYSWGNYPDIVLCQVSEVMWVKLYNKH